MVESLDRRRVVKFLDAFYSGDAEAALECCDEDYDSIIYVPVELFPHLGHKRGKPWIAESIRTQEERYSSRRYQIRFIATEGPRIATIQQLSLQKRNDGRVVQLDVAEFFTLRDGRIVEHRSFFDSFDFVQQLLGHDLTEAFAASVRGAVGR